ncbi:MAG: glycosyltransferase [Bryobacterales bacterium]|nr:glycosyltransferase [Bryobacterales bacterium]
MKGRSGEAEGVLFLSPEAPYPLAGGGAMRTAGLLRYLADRYTVDFLGFAVEGGGDPSASLPDGLVRRADTVWLPRHGVGLGERIVRNSSRVVRGRLPLMDRFFDPVAAAQVQNILSGRRYRLAVIEHFWCADYLSMVREVADVVILDLHNVESALHAGCAQTEPWPQRLGHRFFHRRAEELERRMFAQFDLVLATSRTDAARVRALSPGVLVQVMPNSIPLRAVPEAAERQAIAFSGNLEYHPNVSAVRFFATQVWPNIRRKHNGLVWRLIGKNPHAVQDIVGADPRIELTGEVPDALPEIAAAKVVVAPLLAGSGTRVKIVEAWAAARPVISTPIGAEGLPIVEGENILLAETPENWTKQVLQLLEDERRRTELGAAGRMTFERELCWPATWRALDAVIPPLASSRAVAI